mgnify:CR=1 FL=1
MSRLEFDLVPEGEVQQFMAIAIPGIPEIGEGVDIGTVVYERSREIGGLSSGDVIVIASKIISKAEGRVVDISSIEVTDEAKELSQATGKPVPVCQLILDESSAYIVRGQTIVAHHKLGYLLTSAGVDQIDESHVSLIPKDPDLSAKRIRETIENLSRKEVAVVISDSEGREDRAGAGAVALGVSGISPIRKTTSPSGKQQEETISDMIANAASILIGQRGRNTPVVVIKGLDLERNIESRMQDYLGG